LFLLHRTSGAPTADGGPAMGAYGCTEARAPYLPARLVVHDGQTCRLDHDCPKSCGKIRAFRGNVPQVVKAHARARAMGGRGIDRASDISVVATGGVDAPMRQYTPDRYREAMDLAAEWSGPFVVVIPGPVNSLMNPPRQWMPGWFAEGVQALVTHARGVQTGPAAQALRDTGHQGATVLEIITDALAPGADPDGDIRASHAVLAANGWAALG
jgi:hypothetical protein